MATTLRPCPACQRPMESARQVCAYCQRAGASAPEAPTVMSPPPRRKSERPWPAEAFLVSLALPIIGIGFGLIRAFDPDPERRRLAGLAFAGAAVGCLAWWFLIAAFGQPAP